MRAARANDGGIIAARRCFGQTSILCLSIVASAACRAGPVDSPVGAMATPSESLVRAQPLATDVPALDLVPAVPALDSVPDATPSESLVRAQPLGTAAPALDSVPDATALDSVTAAPTALAVTLTVAAADTRPADALGTDPPSSKLEPSPSGVADLGGVTHVWQKWNNCGPASALMALSVFGVDLDQMAVAARLKPDREDTNVTPQEMAAFVQSMGLEVRQGYGGDRQTARAAVVAGVPLIAEQWIDVEGRGQMGHYVVVIGFDDSVGEVIVHDSYYGARRRHTYDAFERMWRPFLGAYVIPYRSDGEGLLRGAMGTAWDSSGTWDRLRAEHEMWAAVAPDDAWAWFTLGEARSRTGDHGGAVAAFDRAIAIGLPFRAFWYQFGFYRSLFETGSFERIVEQADLTLASMDGENLEESRYWKGRALEAMGLSDAAVAEYRTALTYNPLYEPARRALDALAPSEG